jgi:serralysin
MRGLRLFSAGLCLAALPNAAHARFHYWDVNEVFSNADGTIQYVEFTTQMPFQDLIGTHGVEFRKNAAALVTVPFVTNLFTTDTTGHSLLVATPAFAAAAGIDPDYPMPAGTIPVADVDAIRMSDAPATEFDFTAGTIPLDGVHSLNRDTGVAAATPTNFAGEVGTIVPEPVEAALAAVALGALGGLALRRGGASRRR